MTESDEQNLFERIAIDISARNAFDIEIKDTNDCMIEAIFGEFFEEDGHCNN